MNDLVWEEIESIEECGEDECYDIMLLEDDVLDGEHNFIADGFIVHNCGMHNSYINRKNGNESYELHPLIKPVLGSTYGVMVFQEQVMKILNIVGNIPLIHCEKVRKAISKKKESVFLKYKIQFVENGQKNLGWTKEEVEDLWNQIVSFAEYGFNKSVSKGTLIPCVEDGNIIEKKIENICSGDVVVSIDEHGSTVKSSVVNLHDHGEIDGYEVIFDDGYSLVCSLEHKFLTKYGQKTLREIIGNNYYILCDDNYRSSYAKEKDGWVDNSLWINSTKSEKILRALQDVRGVQEQTIYNRGMDLSLWGEFQDTNFDEEASTNVQEVSKFILENERQRSCGTQGKMRCNFGHLSTATNAPKKLFRLRQDQKGKYCEQKYGHQSVIGTPYNIIENGENNFCKTRYTTSEGREIKVLEKRKSRKIRKMYRSDVEKSQKIKNGSVDSQSDSLGYDICSMWEGSQTGGFWKGQNMDRSGWILPFLREPTCRTATKTFVARSEPRFDVKTGSSKTEGHNVDSDVNGVFREFDGNDENGMVGYFSDHAPISNTRGLVPRKIIRVKPVGKRQMYDLEVACPTHNFLLPTGIVTSNSHAVAYTYISSRLLYLKAHYPIEFFAAILSCESDGDKIKDYKVEAEKNGLEICSVDINKSKETFDIVDEKIYIGFSNIKGIGPEPAKRIVASQPYASFEDFLHRFGTDAAVVKPLLALRVFKDSDPATLWEFSEYYKAEVKRREDRKKRHLVSCEAKIEDLRKFHQEMTVDYHGIKQLKKKYKDLRRKFLEKVAADKPIAFADFKPIGKIDPALKAIFDGDTEGIEKRYYGFGWTHELLLSPDYDGYTFEQFKDSVEKEATALWLVEVRVVEKPKEIMSQKKNVYYSVKVEDAEWHTEFVKIWADDWERWKNEFSYWDEALGCGNLLKIRLKHTVFNGRSSYSFEAPKKQDRWKLPPKEDDFRLTVMRRK